MEVPRDTPLFSQPLTTVNSKDCIGCNELKGLVNQFTQQINKLSDLVNTLLQKSAVQSAAPTIQKNSRDVVPQCPQYPLEQQPIDIICKRQLADIEIGLAEIRTKTQPIDAFLNSFKIT